MANPGEAKCVHNVPYSQFCPDCQSENEDEFDDEELDDYGEWDDEDDDEDDWVGEDDELTCAHEVPWDEYCEFCEDEDEYFHG